MAAIAAEISAPFGASHSWNCGFKIKCADAVWVELVMNVQMCVHSARVTPPPRPTWPRQNIGKANRTCTIHARHTAHYQAHSHTTAKFCLDQQIHWKKCAERRRELGGYSRHVLMELRNIFSHKVWESWQRMPQVETSFSFNQKIPWKRCAERHRELGGYSRQVSSRRKSEYLSMSVTTHLQYRKLIPFF